MPLPAPSLDDRRFQDLVDEAKRLVQQRCPEWTDHNVSDPGVTLIEAFAVMTDQLLYRLNRVPDRLYVKFLELIGVRLYPPTAARCGLTFWLAAARDAPVVVPAGTEVATVRTEQADAIVFSTESELAILPSRLDHVLVARAGGRPVDRSADLAEGAGGITCFADRPEPGDSILFGLSAAVPRGAVLLRLGCAVAGIGVDPTDPPLVWEAWSGTGWTACELDSDGTGGLNRAGDVILHVPAGHAASVLGGERGGWLRCRVVPTEPGQAAYQESPRLLTAAASTIGGTAVGVHGETARDEVLGLSEGVPGQRFTLPRTPVVTGEEPFAVEVAGGDGWDVWREVDSFADSGPGDRHIVLDRSGGEVLFGPAVRQPDGSLRHYGAVPPKAAPIRVPAYRTGGGRRGNVARDMLTVLRSAVPFVSRVTNRRAATGGVDGESLADAAARGPLQLRTRDRAVTAEDYEQLARQAAPHAARVRCVPADNGTGVRVLVVPAVAERAQPRFADLKPPQELLQTVADFLDERRCLGARVIVAPPFYQGVTVVAQLKARPRASTERVQAAAQEALHRYLNPLVGGPDGTGWPFGRPIQSGDVYAVLQRVSGVDIVEDVRLFGADPITGERGSAVPRLDLPDHALVFSYGHQVRVS